MREAAIDAFLTSAGWDTARREKLPGDASFRRYVRLYLPEGSAMLMDAPPAHEDVRPFARVARHLASMGYSAPRLLAEDEDAGFLLLEDLGNATYTRELARGADERALYAMAVDLLIDLHRRTDAVVRGIPPYDDARFLEEVTLLIDWYMPAVTGAPVSDDMRRSYLAAWRAVLPFARRIPDTLVLRDYHVDNLMVVAGRAGLAACGLLDFQDAVIGPASYDLVSLLEDARRDLAPGLADEMLARYLAAFSKLDHDAFRASYAILGAQRNAKIIGIFTRLCRRDGKPRYLTHIPRVWRLLEGDLAHPALAPVRAWFDRHLPPGRRIVPAAPA